MEGKSYLQRKRENKETNYLENVSPITFKIIGSNIKNNEVSKIETTMTNINKKQKNKSLSFTLNNKTNFNDKKIITIKELSNNKIGILFVNILSFYSSKTFKKINEINLDITKNPEKNEEDSDNQNEIIMNFQN